MWNSECGMQKKAARGRSMKARPTQSRKGVKGKISPCRVKGGLRPFSSVPCGVWGNASTVPRATSISNALNKGAGSEASLPVTLRVRRRAPKLFFSPRFREEPKNCLPKSNFSGRQEIHSLIANIFVDKYRSPVSGRMTTMFLPANSGRAATCDAAQTAAPDVMPASTPSCAASSRPVR